VRVAGVLRRLLATALGQRSDEQVASIPEAFLELARSGPANLTHGADAVPDSLRIATVIPSFRRGSGGHATVVNLMRELAAMGHSVSLWLEDCEGRHARETEAVTRRSFAAFFSADDLDLHVGFRHWQSADVVLATGWQTVPRVLLLPGVLARAYLVQDHEPDFYPASADRVLAESTYRFGLHCLAASPWLAELLRTRYGATTTQFDLAVDHDAYAPRPVARREDLVVFYSRIVTPRRAVPLGLLALEELARRQPGVEIQLFGDSAPITAHFGHVNLGVLNAQELAILYSEATVGMAFSLTNPSLTALEMMACGLPCLELGSKSVLATFGVDGPVQIARPDPVAIATAVEHLLGHPELRADIGRDGIAFMATRTWSQAARQIERGVREALQVRHLCAEP
jgi:glycosyltransferase involved in cell wall biosynthesis